MSDVPHHRVHRLYLRDVGPFRELDLTLAPKKASDKADLHLLVGPNGCGKTTILQAIAAFMDPGGAPRVIGRFTSPSSLAWLRLHAGDAARLSRTARPAPSTDDAPFPVSSVTVQKLPSVASDLTWYGPTVRRVLDARRWAETLHPLERPCFAALAYSGQRRVSSEVLKAIQEPESPPLMDALGFDFTADTGQFVQWVANSFAKAALARDDGDELAAARYRAPLERIEGALRAVVGENLRLALLRDPLQVVLRRDDRTIPLDVLPDGVKSILSWVGDLVMRLDRVAWEGDVPVFERAFLLLLDEVDIHLHPSWQRKVLPMVQRLFPNAQIIATTHSPFVVASVSDAWVYRFGVRGGASVLEAVLPSQAGHSYREVLQDAFQVTEEFDDETERELDAFYALRDAVLAHARDRYDELRDAAKRLAARGEALEDIAVSELAQVDRLLGRAA